MLLPNTIAVVAITLGFITFGVWHKEIVAKRGGGGGNQTIVESFSNERTQNGGARPNVVYQTALPSCRREIFVM